MKQFFLLILLISSTVSFSQTMDKEERKRLDSVVLEANAVKSKIVSIYNEHENEKMRIEYRWSAAENNWWVFRKCEYVYDSNQNLIIMTDEDFYGYEGIVKNEYAYDVNGNQIMYVRYHCKNGSSGWDVVDKTEFEYDSNGRKVLFKKKNWKEEYAYDDNGKQTIEIYYDWDDIKNSWQKFSKRDYQYNGKGNLKKTVICYLDENACCENSTIIRYKYDAYNNQIEVVGISIIKSIRRKKYKVRYTYDSNKDKTGVVTYFRGKTSWIEDEKIESIYDNNHNLVKSISYYRSNDTLEMSNKGEYVYDTSYLKENCIFPPSDSYKYPPPDNGTNLLIEAKHYHWEANEWKCVRWLKYYYSP